jgi:hypothetical protein
MAAAKEGSSSDRIEELLLAHKWLTSMCCSVIAILVLLPVYAERVAEPADANAGTGCWVVSQYSVNAARPGGGVYREGIKWGWKWHSDDAVLPPCCQNLTNQTELFIPYDESYAQAFRDHDYWARNYTLRDLSFCEEDATCASCAEDAFTVEAATCAAGRCESRRSATDGSCTCDRAYEDTQGGGGRWACDAVRGCQWRRDFYVGLPSYAPPYWSWWAQDEDFASFYALYLLAVAASAFGVAASLLIRREFRRSDEDAASTPFRAYLKALVAYFGIQLFTNLAVFCSFMTFRCEHHNVKFTRSLPVHESNCRFSPWKDLVKNYRVHPTHWLIYAQAPTTATARARTRRWRTSSAALGSGLMASRAGAQVKRDRFRKTGGTSTATR